MGRTVYRNCPICEACCGLAIALDDAGEILSVKGDADDPVSRGYVCPKSQALVGVAKDPDRLQAPLLRRGDSYQEIPWPEALDLAATRLRESAERHGNDSVGVYIGNPTAGNPGLSLYAGALIGALRTRQIYSASSIDAHPRLLTSALLYGDKAIMPLPDIDHCDLLVIVGANPLVSNGSMLTAPGLPHRLRALRQRGGRIVVIDPRKSETVDIADQHLAVTPSTDALLLLATVHTSFDEGLIGLGELAPLITGLDDIRIAASSYPPERVAAVTGVDPGVIRQLARDLAASPRAAVYGRIGACCQEFGTLTSWLIDVLNILTGNLDVRGGSIFSRPVPTDALARDPYVGAQAPYDRYRTRVSSFPEFSKQFPVAFLSEEIETAGRGQIRAMAVLAGNPIVSLPNGSRLERALRSLDFMVSVDLYRNETSRLADLILPPTSHLERSDFPLHFTNYMVRSYARYSPAVSPKQSGSHHDWEILLELGARLADARIDEFHRGFLLRLIRRVQKATALGKDIGPDEILSRLGGEDGPEKIFDLLLRAGDFGDRVGANPAGLTLAALRGHDHGIDYGPAETGVLPDRLKTPGRRIHLAPEPMLRDLERLARFLDQAGDRQPDAQETFRLSSRRETRSMNSWLHNVRALGKGGERCLLLIHPDDADRLDLRDGDVVQVASQAGQIIVPVEISERVKIGSVNLPHGFGHDLEGSSLTFAGQFQVGRNVNLLLGDDRIDLPSGNVAFNDLPVTIAPAPRSSTAPARKEMSR
jgi:anaerobic selenocysteine-containing dehydrogenase